MREPFPPSLRSRGRLPTVRRVDRPRTWQVIEQQRLQLADLLSGLSDEEWERSSLCSAWRIRDVAAHLTLVGLPPTGREVARVLRRSAGGFDAVNAALAVQRGARPPEQLVAELRQHASSRKVPPVTKQSNLLFDVLVHGQDIAVPLGLDLPMPADGAVAGAERVWRMGWPFWARRRLRGLRLVATDVPWSAGSGADVRGPIAALLLLLTGRTAAAVPLLSGEGT